MRCDESGLTVRYPFLLAEEGKPAFQDLRQKSHNFLLKIQKWSILEFLFPLFFPMWKCAQNSTKKIWAKKNVV